MADASQFIRCKGAEGVEEFTRRLVEESGVLFLPSSIYHSELGRYRATALRVGFGRSHVPAGLAVLRKWLDGNPRDALAACVRGFPDGIDDEPLKS